MRGIVLLATISVSSCGMLPARPISAGTSPERRELLDSTVKENGLWRGLGERDPAANAAARDGLVKLGAAIVPRLVATIREHIGDEDETMWRSAYDVLEQLGAPDGFLRGDWVFYGEALTAVDAKLAELVAGEDHETKTVEGIEFIRIPAGWSVSGTNVKAKYAGIVPPPPLKRVRLGEYWIAKYEVTRGQAESLGISLAGPPPKPGLQPLPGPHFDIPPSWPAGVDWHKAQRWCERFTERTHPELGLRCVLPTELQWEKACRGDFGSHYPWGFGPAPGPFYPQVWSEEIGMPAVGRKIQLPLTLLRPGMIEFDKSPYGVIDMAGGLREWCADKLSEPYAPPAIDPKDVDKYPPYVVKGGELDSDTLGYSRTGFGRSTPLRTGFRPVLVPLAVVAEVDHRPSTSSDGER